MSVSYDLDFDREAVQRALFGRDGELTAFLESYGRRVVARAVMKAPVKTGNLRRSIRAEPVETGPLRASVSVVADANYASYVHEGVSQARIYPRNGKALRFEIGGKVLFRKSVRGNRPARPFLANAAAEVAAEML